jgi:hypothetical protein
VHRAPPSTARLAEAPRCSEAAPNVKGGGHVQVAVAVKVHVADHDQVNVNEMATNLWTVY